MDKMLMLLTVLVGALFVVGPISAQDALQTYLANNSDSSYSKYSLMSTNTSNSSYTIYKLNMSTILWFDSKFSSQPIWRHIMYVIVPIKRNSSRNIVFHIDSGINNGSNTDHFVSPILPMLALASQGVVISMGQVPNQPIRFAKDPSKQFLYEDSLVAWTLREWMQNRNKYPGNTSNNLPLLFPMTKSVKRGMDLALTFLKSKSIVTSGKFFVSGESKRAWAALLVGAIDSRVMGIMSIVFDFINMVDSLHEQYKKMGGGYSYALYDYLSSNITINLDSINLYNLGKLIDVGAYMQKFQNKSLYFILGQNDQFMMPWNTNGFWRSLSIQTNNKAYLRRIADANHYLSYYKQDTVGMSAAGILFLATLGTPKTMPIIQWSFVNNKTAGTIHVSLSNLQMFNYVRISGYNGRTPDLSRKDFRFYKLDSIGNLVPQYTYWTNIYIDTMDITDPSQTFTFSYSVPVSDQYYTGSFIEIELVNTRNLGMPISFFATTETNIVPEFDPVGDCHDAGCSGLLV